MNRAGITADDPDVQMGEWQVLWDWYSCQHAWKLLECGAITANEFAALAEPFPELVGFELPAIVTPSRQNGVSAAANA